MLQVDVELVVEGAERRITGTGAGRVAALKDKVVNDAVEDRVGVDTTLDQFDDP